MSLSNDEKKKIKEEEEYRKEVQDKATSELDVNANLKIDQKVDSHGVGREMYGDAKYATKLVTLGFGKWLAGCFRIIGWCFVYLIVGSMFYMLFTEYVRRLNKDGGSFFMHLIAVSVILITIFFLMISWKPTRDILIWIVNSIQKWFKK